MVLSVMKCTLFPVDDFVQGICDGPAMFPERGRELREVRAADGDHDLAAFQFNQQLGSLMKKSPCLCDKPKGHTQRLKPTHPMGAFGTAEAVPCYKTKSSGR